MLPGASTYSAGEIIDWFASICFPSYTMARGQQMLMTYGINEETCKDYTDNICDAISEAGQNNACCPGVYLKL